MTSPSRQAYFVCSACGKAYDIKDKRFDCDCGGLFDVAGLDDSYSVNRLNQQTAGVFRYRDLLPSSVDLCWEKATMAEGATGLIALEDRPNILAKMDYVMPTLSFKDRGAAVLMAAAKGIGVCDVVQDSSGNAGNSIAAYSARLGISCEIFVPAATSANKVAQMKAYGAAVTLVPGTREDTASAALAAARSGRYYASHVYNPLFYQGTKTYIYEIFEQMGNRLPDALTIPIGNGTMLFGLYYGLKSLLAGGVINKYPKVVCVQASACAPVYNAFKSGMASTASVINHGTAAEGIAIAAPMRGAQMLSVIKELGGIVYSVTEEEIAGETQRLAHSGFFVEPTSAAAIAGATCYINESGFQGSMVFPLCGSGLKSLH